MVRFIHTTPDKPGPWRRQARQACPACRRRKKRCKHVGSSGLERSMSFDEGGAGESVRASASSFNGHERRQGSGEVTPSPGRHVPVDKPALAPREYTQPSETDPQQSSDAHFVGDLNPESTFLADSPETGGGYTAADGIGVWVSRRAVHRGGASGLRGNVPSATEVMTLSPGGTAESSLAVVPGESHYRRLEEIYLRDIHKILPVIDLNILRGGGATTTHILTKQAICLAAAAHPDAQSFLTLATPTTPLSHAAFSEQLISAIRSTLSSILQKDRLQLIPPLVILALNTYSSPDRHLSTELASLAVSYTQTVGLHHRSPPTSQNPEYLERLFCSVWAMDRLNAALHGRPVLMHERDFGRDLEACFARQESCFRLFLECVMLLDGVIHLYRPTVDQSESGWELPRFEELVGKAGAFGIEARLLVTIELLYHAIVILSSRAPSETRSSTQVTPRESLSSHAITTIIGEFRDKLPHMTFVPYAASLALRTTYRELRASTVPTVRARSFKQLRDNCRMLQRFEEIYRPASIMVGLVDRLTREVDRVSGNPARSDPTIGTSTTSHPGNMGRTSVGERAGIGAGSVEQDVQPRPVLDAMPMEEDLSRLDVFESLNFDYDFDALDAAFGDYTYPSMSEFT